MITVKLPDGSTAQFPDGTAPDTMKTAIQRHLAKTPDMYASGNVKKLTGSVPPQPESYDQSSFAQNTSGLNAGIANAIGAPVEIANMAIGAGMQGVNALTGSDFQPSQSPVGGQEFFRNLMGASIKPPTTDPGKQFSRRVFEEVGAMAIPGMGTIGKAAKPLKLAAAELGSAVASGTGAAVAQQVAPGNALAEFGGQMLGGLTPSALLSTIRRKVAPRATSTVEELTTLKNAAYKQADNAGVAYSPQGYDRMLANIAKDVQADNFNADRHKMAASFLQDMVGKRGQPLTLTQLDQLRQNVRRDLITPSYGNQAASADAHFGYLILDEIDDFIATAKAGDVITGSADDANKLILAARELNTRLRKTELLEDALTRAERRAASTGSGGNINNAIRQNIRAILDSPKKRRAFTKAELFEMEALIRQGSMENFLRWVGKFSPTGNGLIGMLQVGGTILNPAMAALPIAGMVAKGIADKGTLNKVAKLQANVSKMPPLPKPPRLPSPVMGDLLYAQMANQGQ